VTSCSVTFALLVVHLAARGLQRTLLGGELGLVLGKLLLGIVNLTESR
jgi:hypothetical protein